VTREAGTREFWETTLLKMHFAALPCAGAGPALEALAALSPDLIVADPREVPVLRDRLPPGRRGGAIPIVEHPATTDSVDTLIRQIRDALRASQAV
jgi:hypothetical protein